jgi:hypothetical protein
VRATGLARICAALAQLAFLTAIHYHYQRPELAPRLRPTLRDFVLGRFKCADGAVGSCVQTIAVVCVDATTAGCMANDAGDGFEDACAHPWNQDPGMCQDVNADSK